MRRRKHIALVSLAAFLTITSLAGSAYAFRQVSSDTVNTVHLSSLKNSIIETYQEAKRILPGEQVDKVVNVTNEGNTPALIRVKLQVALGEEREGEFTADELLDASKVQLVCSDTWWFYDKQDGFYYYKGILLPGEMTREPLLRSFSLSKDSLREQYANRTGRILVSLESVQAEGDGVSLWGKTYTDLGVERPKQKTAESTSVTYLGMKKKFDIEEVKTDLFANFKNLVPGDARSQAIYVGNGTESPVKIYLFAQEAKQSASQDQELVENLLKKYARITIKNGREEIYRGTVWGNLDAEEHTMREPIFLGEFRGEETKRLTVTLKLSPLMDNRYREVLGKVQWVFLAREDDQENDTAPFVRKSDDGEPTSYIATPVKTGDDGALLPALGALAAACTACVCGIRLFGKRRR